MQLEFTREDVIKIISLMQAVVDGKTIQAPNGNGGWIDIKEVLVNDLLLYYKSYRIKPEPKYNLELTTEELDVVKSSLSAFMLAKTNETAQKLCRNILDNIDRIEEGCPDILCDDCTKECEMKKIMKQANESLDLDKIADEVEQDIKEQSEEVTIASVWEKRDEVPLKLKISEIYTEGNPTIEQNTKEIDK